MSLAQKGKIISQEHRNIMSEPVIQYTKDLKLIKSYKSFVEAEEETGVSKPHIHACCNRKRASAGGFIWKYENDREIISTFLSIAKNKKSFGLNLVVNLKMTSIFNSNSLEEVKEYKEKLLLILPKTEDLELLLFVIEEFNFKRDLNENPRY